MQNFIILIFSLLPILTHAIPEKDFESIWKTEALPWFQNLESGEFRNKNALTLKYYIHRKPHHKKILVIVPGRTEPAMKYTELFYDLKDSGFDLYIMDHQGQGESERLLRDSHKGHVLHFSDYVDDFEQFMNEVVIHPEKEIYLLAHSMGGAIATKYMNKNPDVVKKAVLVAPMFEINTKPYSEKVAKYYAKLLVSLGKGNNYAPDWGPWEYIPFSQNEYTHSEVRYHVERFLFTTFPEVALGGPTARWVYESIKATQNMDCVNLKTPVLLLQAGLDTVVKPGRQNRFCKREFCTLKTYPYAKHEILMETDAIRNDALKMITSFFGP